MSSPSLLDVPDKAMKKVLEKLDFISVQRLRKTCHELRNFIDDSPPDSAMTKVHIRLESQVIAIHFWYDQNDEDQRIEYQKGPNNTCLLIHYEMCKLKKKGLENVDFVDVVCGDLGTILKNQKPILESLTIDFQFSCFGNQNDKEQNLEAFSSMFLEKFNVLLKSMPRPLQVKTFQTTVTSQNQVLEALQCLDRKTLRNLTISNTRGNSANLEYLEIGELVKLEQWKRVEVLNILNFWVEPSMEDFVHFKVIYVGFKDVSMKLVDGLKKNFLESSHLEYFKIRFEHCEIQEKLSETFGNPITDQDQLGQTIRKWYFQTSTPYRILSILLYPFQIIFNRIDISNVPENAKLVS